jgi:succinylglutamate desuccinylase
MRGFHWSLFVYTSSLFLLRRSLATMDPTRVKSIVVVGGTHGNEYTGVFVSKALERRLKIENPYKTFHLSTIIANPEAHLQNKRFIHQDLNRQFSYKALEDRDGSEADNAEAQRASELNQLLGPKFSKEKDSCGASPKTDVLIDLHTTTANMGTTLIVAQGDPLTTKAAAYVMLKCRNENKISVLMHTHENQESRPHLSSIAPHCFSIEAGPVPQGVLRHDIVENTQEALEATLQFFERYNTNPEEVDEELRQAFPSGRITCYVSAPSKRKGEISSKIDWPSDPENPNFPAWMVHKSVQDRDFAEIHAGDPLFVDLDGKTIPYDGSHGSPVTLLFINEGGYYYASSGTGISVAQRRQFLFESAKLLPLEETE